ncbi:hypothetical protein HPB51_014956 [Rhipicephalus microplus]|uniref:Sulfotransferase domain-containing protein n=1 Tax=Rhipicephalus microplus TaxID=6941 RepID=A0A9J6E1V2_RHIMP|nr:hypothetical protein HPB51_014956 [Rhipicephalus microplus]
MAKDSGEGQPVARTLALDFLDGVLVPPTSIRRDVLGGALLYEAPRRHHFGDVSEERNDLDPVHPAVPTEPGQRQVAGRANVRRPLDQVGRKVVEATPAPRVIKTHFSSTMTPYHPKAKYVIIVRNPFDCVVSFYHHCMGDRINLRMRADTKFDEFSEDFMDGYNFKSDPKKTVLALAKFVDASVWQKLRANKALLKVLLERISFANLKSDVKMDVDIHHTLVDRNHHEEKSDAKEIDEKRTGKSLPHKSFDDADDPARNTETPEEEAMVAFANFFRKGEVGDWKRYLNPEQEKRLRAVYEKRKRGTEMWDAWKDYLGYKDASARANKGS